MNPTTTSPTVAKAESGNSEFPAYPCAPARRRFLPRLLLPVLTLFLAAQGVWGASDLIPQNLAVNPTSGNAGTTATVTLTVRNQGGSTASASTMNLRLSASSSSVTTSDALLASVNIPAIAAGSTYSVNLSVTIPSGTAAGQKYVWAILDLTSSAGQGSANEANDKSNTGFNVTTVVTTITRDAVITTAQSYANCAWQCIASNTNSTYNNFISGTSYVGMAYNWGGFDTISQFQSKISAGAVAGNYKLIGDGDIHSDFAGIDCSGFVSRCWNISTKYSTTTLPSICVAITSWSDLKPGDAINLSGKHVRLFDCFDPSDSDSVWVYEATYPRVQYVKQSISGMKNAGYVPLRYNSIIDATTNNTLSINQANWDPSVNGGTLLVTVTSNNTWIVYSGAPSWLTTSPGSGTNNGPVTLTVSANTTVSKRTANVTFTSGTLTQRVMVTQAGTQVSGTALTSDQAAQIAYDAGFRGNSLVVAIAVAQCESQLVIAATNESTIENSYGIWQINRNVHPEFDKQSLLSDPSYNAHAAWLIYGWAGNLWTPWTMFTNGNFAAQLPLARTAAQKVDATVITAIGDRITTPDGVNVRPTAGDATVTRAVTAGVSGTILDGPVVIPISGGDSQLRYVWWRIHWDDTGADGWSAENFLSRLSTPVATLPDLIPQSLAVNPTSCNAGTAATVTLTVRNQGGSTASASTMNLRLSVSSSSVTTADALLASVNIPAIAAGSTYSVNQSVTIPSGTAAGQKYVWAILDLTSSAGQGSANEANDKSNTGFNVVVAPSFNSQPSDKSVTAGQTATFTVAASGTPAPTYQWQLSSNGGGNWTNVTLGTGGTTATYTTSVTTTNQSGTQFRCVATNSVNSATSNAVTLTVTTTTVAPSFTLHPANASVTAGQTASFTVAASGSPTPTYQWQVYSGSAWTNINGATSATYAFTTAIGDNNKQFHCVATNSVNSATSNAVTLTVTSTAVAPSFTLHPANTSVTAGQTASFTVAASGSPTPTCQWQVYSGSAWGNIVGATSATYSFTTVVGDNGKQFRCVATNSVNVATSNAATLTVTTPTDTVIFSDDFNDNSLDTSVWTASGNVVQETAQQMQVLCTVQDAFGVLNSKEFPINRTGIITITRKVNLHYANNYAVLQFHVKAGNLGWFGLSYANYNYSVPAHGFYLIRNDAFVGDALDAADFSPAISAVWDTWFDEKLTYDPVSGQMSYYINNEHKQDFNVGALPAGDPATLSIFANGGGWLTGHSQLFDDICISQTATAPLMPAFTVQPASRSVTAGQTASFTVTATGMPTPTYQWQGSSNGGGTWADVTLGTGGTTATYTTSVTTTSQSGIQFRCVATNSAGTINSNSAALTVTAPPSIAPTVTTTALVAISTTTATSGGQVTNDGGAVVTARGVCWSTSTNPTVAGAKTTDGAGTGVFASTLTGLSTGTTYYVRAYATNSVDTTYGEQCSFTTACTVTFDAESGTVEPTSKTVTFNVAYGTLPPPSRTGYAFAGWWTGADGTGTLVTAETMVSNAADHLLHAKWTAR